MAAYRPGSHLVGRAEHCAALDDLIAGAEAGQSAALVLRGEAGIGKSELLRYVEDRADGCRVVRAAGVQSEMELAYAGLHQLTASLLDGVEHLPGPQANALETAFGLRAGPGPGRFLVGLATLGLVAHAATRRPLVCLVDDVQWMDQASVLTLGFVARRLVAESVVMVLAVREPLADDVLVGLPGLEVAGLSESDSQSLVDSIVPLPLDPRVRDRVIAEARGNPLALLELPRWLAHEGMTAEVGSPEPGSIPSQLEQVFARQIRELPELTQRLLCLAAADPFGDVSLLRRAAGRLGIDVEATVSAAEVSELVAIGTHVRFRHPLVRSAAYRSASESDRRMLHGLLAESIDTDLDIERRAWHRAYAAFGPDEEVADELERLAARVQSRGGAVSAGALLDRATALTAEPALRSQRALRGAQAKLQAGAFESAELLLTIAAEGPPDDLMSATTERLRGHLAFAQKRGNDAAPLLLGAAERFEALDIPLARETYLEAIGGALVAGRFPRGPGLREVGARASTAPPAAEPRLPDRLLDALAARLGEGHASAAVAMRAVLGEICAPDLSDEDMMRWGYFGSVLASDLLDLDSWHVAATKHVSVTRATGALSDLAAALDALATVHLLAGDMRAARACLEEARNVCQAIGSVQAQLTPLGFAAFSGQEQEARALLDVLTREAVSLGQGAAITTAYWYQAVLCNGLGQHDEAAAAARQAAALPVEFTVPRWALVELVEAAAHLGHLEEAADAVEQLAGVTRVCGTDWALGVEARSRALVTRGAAAERHHREAIRRLERTRARVDLARAHLVHGEWLRRQDQSEDARQELATAHQAFADLGLDGFARRARDELRTVGVLVHEPTAAPPGQLTAQEEQIARLAASGLTNPAIADRLLLSPHTIEWHLRKVFSKLGISSRKDIASTLPADP